MQPQTVLTYWFGEQSDDQAVIAEKGSLWFRGGPAVDAEITARFNQTVVAAAAGELDAWAETPTGALALIVLLDQFTRNIYRGTAQMYDADPKARALADGLVRAGLDQQLRPIERVFVYLPFEHHEDLASQDRSVALFEALAAERPDMAGYVQYAESHRTVIRDFGRFPHRNPLLGRLSTPEEEAYLAAGGGF